MCVDILLAVSKAALVLGRGNDNWSNVCHRQLSRGNLKLKMYEEKRALKKEKQNHVEYPYLGSGRRKESQQKKYITSGQN